MKSLFTTVIVFIALLAAAAAATEGAAPTVESSCRAACNASRAEICEPAEQPVRDGRLTEEMAAKLCQCGVDVCSNVCACSTNYETPCLRPVSAECVRLGVNMPE
jgi:hypothetical protein